MLRPYDKEYKATKLIKKGKASLNKEFVKLAEWINNTYHVMVLNIIKDALTNNTDRLEIIFEHKSDMLKFFGKDTLSPSKQKQKAIAKKYFELISAIAKSNNPLVLFYAFEPLAKEEANTAISNNQIEALKKQYSKELWEIQRYGEFTTFFFYTNAQLTQAENNDLCLKLKQAYFKLLKPYNEFGYFTEENFKALFDSKENFDKKYDGNWRNYYN